MSRNVILKLSEEKLVEEAKVYTENISGWIAKILAELQVYKDTIENAGFANDEEILQYMEISVDKNEAYPIGIYMGDETGVYLDASGWVPGDDWVLTERDWYIEGKDNTALAFGEPYYDSQSGDTCVSVTARMKNPDVVRVMAADVYLDYVSNLVTEIAAKDGGRAFLVTGGTETIIAHPDPEMTAVTLDAPGIDSLYANVRGVLQEGKTGIVSVEGDAGAYFVCLNRVENTDWYLVSYMSRQEVLAELTRMEMIMAIIAVVAALVLISSTLHIMNRVVKPVQKMTHVITGIAEGDFSQNLVVKGNDEIAQMSHNMQLFIVHMRETIGDISSIADWLGNQSEENAHVSDSLMDSARKQSGAMNELQRMVEQLSGEAAQLSGHMDHLLEVVQTTKAEGVTVNGLARECVLASDNGRKNMACIAGGMEGISSSITSLSDQISRVGEATGQIGDMVDIIVNIADETNLLALNASIEAARAGEAGRGFAVVAEQIGQLAANSATAADDISKLTAEIRTAVSNTLEQTQQTVKEVSTNAGIVGEAGEAFTNVFDKVNETSHTISKMLDLIGQVDQLAADMGDITRTQVSVAGQIDASAKELELCTRNVTDNSNTVAKSAEELKKESESLMEHMSKFKTGDDENEAFQDKKQTKEQEKRI